MPKTLVFGKTGQIAQSLKTYFPDGIFLGRDQADFENPSTIMQSLQEFHPKLVINAAAYTEVDRAETERSRARSVNAEGPYEIALWCKRHEVSLLHYSTDYVYDGSGDRPWTEDDIPLPQNYYGETKLDGERSIQATGVHHVILRTSWIHSPFGKNFVKSIMRLLCERNEINIVNDQIGAPTYSFDIAEVTSRIVSHPNFAAGSGIYNVANSGFTSWHGFAVQIAQSLVRRQVNTKASKIGPISSAEYSSAAIRPKNSRLNCDRLRETFGIEMRSWQLGLEPCLDLITTQIPSPTYPSVEAFNRDGCYAKLDE